MIDKPTQPVLTGVILPFLVLPIYAVRATYSDFEPPALLFLAPGSRNGRQTETDIKTFFQASHAQRKREAVLIPIFGKQANLGAERIEFEKLVNQAAPANFLAYRGMAYRKRLEITSLLDFLKFELRGKVCLDIGPGHGESLDCMHERGAAECAFVERDWWFYRHNELKPYCHGWRLNHLWQLHRLPQHHFDFLWMRGSISSRGRYLRFGKQWAFRLWIRQVISLLAPEATLVFSPYWNSPDWLQYELRAFQKLPSVPGHNSEPEYPVTWIVTGRMSLSQFIPRCA